ncbi:hypothetical protein V6N11_055274 [Hibiscus sabdariffa]|uniref:Uncharacterized protein n=1 Tax=Hibiscus sabdariffa TaxID=183260 RepID=A0ABR2PF77_9ROSI
MHQVIGTVGFTNCKNLWSTATLYRITMRNLAISKALAFFFHCSSKTPDAAAGFAFCSSSSSLYLEGW